MRSPEVVHMNHVHSLGHMKSFEGMLDVNTRPLGPQKLILTVREIDDVASLVI